jgi:hypothetical protein
VQCHQGALHGRGQIDQGLQTAPNLGAFVTISSDRRNEGIDNQQLYVPDL